MNAAMRKVLLVQEGQAPDGPLAALEDALKAQGADVRRVLLQAPYDTVLDALAAGWVPVLMPAPGPMPDH